MRHFCEQYRGLARLGPYVHGIVILAALAFFCATRPTVALAGVVFLQRRIASSVFRMLVQCAGWRGV